MRIDNQTQLGLNQLEYASQKNTIDNKSVSSTTAEKTLETKVASSLKDAFEVSTAGASKADRQKAQTAITEALKNLPDVRVSKVAELKAQIEAGSYNISGKNIADSIIASVAQGLL